jgi:hypothetical protein
MDILLDVFGWAGGAAFVLAYYLVSAGKLKADGWEYHVLNLFGAVAVGVSAFPKKAWPALGLEVVWGAIALISLIVFLKKRKVNAH